MPTGEDEAAEDHRGETLQQADVPALWQVLACVGGYWD
jgi:hypothetical protein